MKNPVCRLCNLEITDEQSRKGYWASDPNVPDCPGIEVLLVGHNSCVDRFAKESKAPIVVVDISGIEKAKLAEAEFLGGLS